jgi:hypothetical protein
MDVVIRQALQAIAGPDLGNYIAYVAVALSILAVIVKLTPTKKDDEMLEKVQQLYKQVQHALAKPGDKDEKKEEECNLTS